MNQAVAGNIADAVEQITGSRAWLNPNIKSIFEKKIVGPAVTVLMKLKLQLQKSKTLLFIWRF